VTAQLAGFAADELAHARLRMSAAAIVARVSVTGGDHPLAAASATICVETEITARMTAPTDRGLRTI
jgi:hypothetical protein